MISIDPLRLARRQLEIDRERTWRFPHLLEHKWARMSASPLAFLRGSNLLFCEVLAHHPALGNGPRGEGWLVGDAHLENFGAYRTGSLSLGETKRTRGVERVVFDVNDFDDAIIGPWRFDLLRLVTSLVLGGRQLGADGGQTLGLCDALVASYAASLFHRKKAPSAPHAVAALVEKVRTRTRRQLLEGRTAIVAGKRRFVRGPRYSQLAPKLRERAERAFARYVKRLPRVERPRGATFETAFEVLDAAFRVAGTGSLGCFRVAMLVRGKGGLDGAWIFDMKEEGAPSAESLVKPPRLDPDERVATAMRTCLVHPPQMVGTTSLRGSSMLVRRLAPQEDRINLGAVGPGDLEPLARHLGALLAAAHRRGASRLPKRPWTEKECSGLLARAIVLAGMHEATYLAFCHLVRQ